MPPGSTLDQLRTAVSQDRIDTVLLALTDMQGRLQGKRLDARHFLNEVVAHGAEACNYLLAVDVEMNTVSGYAMSSWERGYGDFEMVPDFETLRPVGWHEKTALCLADLRWAGGEPVVASPRQILRAQLERLVKRGLEAFAGTELEFIVFKDTYEEAFEKGYSGLRPANQYNVDYSLLGTARVEPLIGRIRRRDDRRGPGRGGLQGRVQRRPARDQLPLRAGAADGRRALDLQDRGEEIAALGERSITFMAKFNEREGSSCHIHMSVPGAGRGRASSASSAGQLACLRELTLLYAPNVNSYKRFASGSFAPTAVAWGHDNRTCAVRVLPRNRRSSCGCRAPT